ncbi:MAG: flavoprotein [Propionibacteriaceae bacterium]
MTEAELRALIVDVIVDLMRPAPRRALVLFTGGLLGFEDALAELKLLAADGVELHYLQTPSAKRVLDQGRIRAVGMRDVTTRMVAEHDMLIAPTLTSNIAAKVAHGVADCLASNLFSEFIMSNKLVVASRSAVCPDGAPKRGWFPQMPPAYADLLRSNLSALASYGVRLTDARFLYRTAVAAFERRDLARRAPVVATLGTSVAGFLAGVAALAAPDGQPDSAETAAAPTPGPDVVPCRLSLISQQVIQALPTGTELRVSAGAKVTAMARDLAASRSIRISREV